MKKVNPKTIAILLSLLISFVILLLNERYMKDLDSLLYNILMTISVSILTTAIISAITERFVPDQIDEIVSERFCVLKDCQDYGLYGIEENFPLKEDENNKIRKDFVTSKSVTIVMNDAKAFISSNTMLLQERLKNTKNATTTIIIQDFNQEDIMSALTRKNGHTETPDYYENKIQEVLRYDIAGLKEHCNSTHKLEVRLNSNYNTLSIILMEHFAMMSIYRVAPGKTRVPHLIYKSGGKEYEDIENDVSKIKTLTHEWLS